MLIPNDYERGVLHGKLEAVRWMLGQAWEDPEDPEDRAWGNKLERVSQLAKELDEYEQFAAYEEESGDFDDEQ